MKGDPPAVVIGGGITGLSAARKLLLDGRKVVVLEAAGELGGKIRTTELEGIAIELGPDSFLARPPQALSLCTALGLEDELDAPAVFGGSIWARGALRAIPRGSFFGVPSSPIAAARSRLLSVGGAARAAAEVVLPRSRGEGDVSIGGYIRARFGDEVLERLVDPVLAGTRAGDPDKLSLAAGLPQLHELARHNRSLILGIRRARRRGAIPRTGPPFVGLRGGMSHLVRALEAALDGADVRTGVAATGIRRAGDAYEVTTDAGAVRAGAVIVATEADRAAVLVAPLSEQTARGLEAIRYAPVAVIALVYPAGAATRPLPGSGFLVPSAARRTLAAGTWVSVKWPRAKPPDGGLLVRAFAGRSSDDAVMRLDDDELIGRAESELWAAAGIRGPARAALLHRWERGVPQYELGHLERVSRIESSLSSFPGVAVAGAAYRGAGIPDCIRQGEDAARRVTRAP